MHVPRTIYTLHKGNNKNSLELNTNTKMVKKNSKISLFVLAQLTNVTDRHRVTAIIAALCIASHGKNGVITHNSNRHAVQYKSSTGDSLISREVSYTGWMLSTGFGPEFASAFAFARSDVCTRWLLNTCLPTANPSPASLAVATCNRLTVVISTSQV